MAKEITLTRDQGDAIADALLIAHIMTALRALAGAAMVAALIIGIVVAYA